MCLYFPHFSDTSHQERYTRLIEDFGATGYGYYWFLVEALGRRPAHKLSIRNGYAIASLLSGVPKKYIKKIVEEYGLFVVDRQAEEFYEPMLIQSLEQAYQGKSEQKDPEEDEQATKPKYTLSDKAIEARKRGGKIGGKKTKSEFKQTKSETKSEDKQTKSEAKQTKSETKSATHGGTMGGKIEKEKNEKVKEHTPQAPQGAGESLRAGGDELEGQAPKASSTTEEHSPKRRKEGGDPWGYDSETEEERAQYEATYQAYEAANEPPTPEEEERERAEREMKRYKTTPATLDEILAMYREHCPRLIPLVGYEQYKVREIVNALRDLTREGLEKMLQRAGRSSFLSGEVNGFRADFLWLMQRDNYRKVLAGNYDDRKPQPWAASATPAPAVGIPIETSDEKRKKLLERMERNVIRTTQPEEQ